MVSRDSVFNHLVKSLKYSVAISLDIKRGSAIRPRLAYFPHGGRSPESRGCILAIWRAVLACFPSSRVRTCAPRETHHVAARHVVVAKEKRHQQVLGCSRREGGGRTGKRFFVEEMNIDQGQGRGHAYTTHRIPER